MPDLWAFSTFEILLQSSRFGEALRSVQEQLDAKNFYAFNPSFDAPVTCPSTGKDCSCARN